MTLFDQFGRRVNYLRISVIDRCNLRCNFCMPLHGLKFYSENALLSFDDLIFTLQTVGELGIDRVRLTGGEPLLRPNLPELIARIKAETGVRQVSMTTNALLLARHAEALVASGLDWINVSLESLDPERYHAITRFGMLETVWEGIRAVASAGLPLIKINTLIMKDINDDEFEAWIDLIRDHDLVVRFLEVMPIGEMVNLGGMARYVNLTEVRERLAVQYGLEPIALAKGNGPARYWKVPGAKGKLGFITPISDRYCDTCSRFRLTAVGDLRPCLAFDTQVSLGEAIRNRDAEAVIAGFRRAAALKPAGHHWEVGQVTATGMSNLGG
ncbi:MAG: GTP 3',8-cyclase MoaA [Anaerolineae bacterium]